MGSSPDPNHIITRDILFCFLVRDDYSRSDALTFGRAQQHLPARFGLADSHSNIIGLLRDLYTNGHTRLETMLLDEIVLTVILMHKNLPRNQLHR